MENNKEIRELVLKIAIDDRFGELPYILWAIELSNGIGSQRAEMRIEHTHVLTGRRVRTATTKEILKFVTSAIKESSCGNVRIDESLINYIASL